MSKHLPNRGSTALRRRLEELRADYQEVTGEPFAHFYCPILFEDENVELCQGHIVNKAFPGSAKKWTVQRKDVDNFYGTNFEADFLGIQYKDYPDPVNALADKSLDRVLKPKILVDGVPVAHYRASGKASTHHTQVMLESPGQVVPLVFKISADAIRDDTMLEIEISADLRLPAIVSAIKAAHLTLFELLGYRYARSAGGQFVHPGHPGKVLPAESRQGTV